MLASTHADTDVWIGQTESVLCQQENSKDHCYPSSCVQHSLTEQKQLNLKWKWRKKHIHLPQT